MTPAPAPTPALATAIADADGATAESSSSGNGSGSAAAAAAAANITVNGESISIIDTDSSNTELQHGLPNNSLLFNKDKFIIRQYNNETQFWLDKSLNLIGIKIDFKNKLNINSVYGLEKQSGITIEQSRDEKSLLIIGNRKSYIEGTSDFKPIIKHNNANEIVGLDSPLLSDSTNKVYELDESNIELLDTNSEYYLPQSLKTSDVLIKHHKNETFLYTSQKIHKLDLHFKHPISLHKEPLGIKQKTWNIVYNYNKKEIFMNSEKNNHIPLNKWTKILIQNNDNEFKEILNINDNNNLSYQVLSDKDKDFFFLTN